MFAFKFTSSNVIAMSIILYLCIVAPSASGKTDKGTAGLSKYRTNASQTQPTKPAELPKPPYNDRHNTSSTSPGATWRNKTRTRARVAPRSLPARKNVTSAMVGRSNARRARVATPTKQRRQNEQPTPDPTGDASTSTTVYINGVNSFALLLPQSSGEMVSDAEEDGIAYCTDGSGCGNSFPDGFITGAAYSTADDGSYLQITGCIDATKFPFADNDDGGQFDNRFPNGAQCTFGGYGASFIEQ